MCTFTVWGEMIDPPFFLLRRWTAVALHGMTSASTNLVPDIHATLGMAACLCVVVEMQWLEHGVPFFGALVCPTCTQSQSKCRFLHPCNLSSQSCCPLAHTHGTLCNVLQAMSHAQAAGTLHGQHASCSPAAFFTLPNHQHQPHPDASSQAWHLCHYTSSWLNYCCARQEPGTLALE
jgi:hypothetical protein